MTRKIAKKKNTVKSVKGVKAGATAGRGKFAPIVGFQIPLKTQKALHKMAEENGSTFNQRFVCQKLAAIANV